MKTKTLFALALSIPLLMASLHAQSITSVDLTSSVIDSVTYDTTGSGDTIVINSGDFINTTLADFNDSNAAQLIDSAAAGAGLGYTPNSNFLDGSIETGVANFDNLELTFTSALTNNSNTVIFVVDIGGINDAFDIQLLSGAVNVGSVKNITANTQDLDPVSNALAFDLFGSTNSLATTGVAALNAESFTKTGDNSPAGRAFLSFNLNEFVGLSGGETVTGIRISGSGFDLVEAGAFAIPEPSSVVLLLGAMSLLIVLRRRS